MAEYIPVAQRNAAPGTARYLKSKIYPNAVVAKLHTMCYSLVMKVLDWNIEKNEWLREVRGVTFEEIVFHVQAGDLLDVLEHDKPDRYPGQRVFVVNVEGYACLVPFVESEDAIFLKTIIPSRKLTRRYLGARAHETD